MIKPLGNSLSIDSRYFAAVLLLTLIGMTIPCLRSVNGLVVPWAELGNGIAGIMLLYLLSNLPLSIVRSHATLIMCCSIWYSVAYNVIACRADWLTWALLHRSQTPLSYLLPLAIVAVCAELFSVMRQRDTKKWAARLRFGFAAFTVAALVVVAHNPVATAIGVMLVLVLAVSCGIKVRKFFPLLGTVIIISGVMTGLTNLYFDGFPRISLGFEAAAEAAPWLVAKGGFWGVGLGLGDSYYFLTPDVRSVFVLAMIGEMSGLLGLLIIMLVIYMLTLSGHQVATNSSDTLSKLLCFGITLWLVLLTFCNVLNVTGQLQTLFVPMPFIANSTETIFPLYAAAGLVLALSRATGPHPNYLRETLVTISSVGDRCSMLIKAPVRKAFSPSVKSTLTVVALIITILIGLIQLIDWLMTRR